MPSQAILVCFYMHIDLVDGKKSTDTSFGLDLAMQCNIIAAFESDFYANLKRKKIQSSNNNNLNHNPSCILIVFL